MSTTKAPAPAKSKKTLTFSPRAMKRALLIAGVLAAAGLTAAPALAQALDTSVFTQGNTILSTVQTNIIGWVRLLGIISLVACGGFWMATGRHNPRWLFAALGGLIVAALAGPAVNLLLPASGSFGGF